MKENTARNNQNGLAVEGGLRISKKDAYLTFTILSLALIMSTIDQTIVSVGIPSIISELHTNLAYVSWTIAGYQLSSCIMMPIIGKLSDDWGRKRLFLMAVVLFTLASIACGLAPNIVLLIIFRILQGVGGAAFIPSATGIISDAFGSRRTTAIGLFSSFLQIGSVIGPNIGGFLIDSYSWRWIFFINIPLGILILISGFFIIPRSDSAVSDRRLDLAGAGLFSGGILAIVYGMTNWANNPQEIGPLTWFLFVLGIIFLILFYRRTNRIPNPIIELKLLKWRPFLAANIYNFFFGTLIFGYSAFIPYYGTTAYGMSAGEDGIVLTPRSIAIIVLSAVTSFFIIRSRYRPALIAGPAIIAVGLFLLSAGYRDVSILGISIQNLWLLTLIVMLGGIGMGFANPAASNAVLDLIPEKVAAVAGLRGMFRQTGGIFGTAAITLILSHFQDKGLGFQQISFGLGVLMVLLIPLTFLIPDMAHARSSQAVSHSTE
jgi:EmrB/QacA subfamily drug resistance transporter